MRARRTMEIMYIPAASANASAVAPLQIEARACAGRCRARRRPAPAPRPQAATATAPAALAAALQTEKPRSVGARRASRLARRLWARQVRLATRAAVAATTILACPKRKCRRRVSSRCRPGNPWWRNRARTPTPIPAISRAHRMLVLSLLVCVAWAVRTAQAVDGENMTSNDGNIPMGIFAVWIVWKCKFAWCASSASPKCSPSSTTLRI